MTIYPIYLLMNIPSNVSECWPYNRFDHVSDVHIPDINCTYSLHYPFHCFRRPHRIFEAGPQPGRRQPADGARRLLRVPRAIQPAAPQTGVDAKRELFTPQMEYNYTNTLSRLVMSLKLWSSSKLGLKHSLRPCGTCRLGDIESLHLLSLQRKRRG